MVKISLVFNAERQSKNKKIDKNIKWIKEIWINIKKNCYKWNILKRNERKKMEKNIE